jgi:hypothetical protein
MATIMARMTRSGTFVGPGTNRKLRPGILGCDILSSLKARALGSLRSGLMASPHPTGFFALLNSFFWAPSSGSFAILTAIRRA